VFVPAWPLQEWSIVLWSDTRSEAPVLYYLSAGALLVYRLSISCFLYQDRDSPFVLRRYPE